MSKLKKQTERTERISPLTINGAKATDKYLIYRLIVEVFINIIVALIICICGIVLMARFVNSNNSEEVIQAKHVKNTMKGEKQLQDFSIWLDGQTSPWFKSIVQAEKEDKITEPKQEIEKKTNVVDEEVKQEVKAYTIKNVKGICQLPELPTGCEITALTALMNYKGIQVNKCELASEYMPRMNFYYEDGKLYGANPTYTFAGNPFDNSGLGCFAPCLCTTVRKYFNTNDELKSKYKAVNLSNKELSYILQEYIACDTPVVVIVSQNLDGTREGPIWEIYHGGTWKWVSNHHAMLVYGFDISKNEIYVCDPLRSNGKYTYNLKEFEEVYNTRGKSAMTIVDR